MRTQSLLTVSAQRSNFAPVFTVQPTGSVSFTQGNAGSQDVSFTATDPNNDPLTFAIVGSLPSGVTSQFFTGFVRLTYTPPGIVGTSDVNISADDGHGNVTQSAAFSVAINAATMVSWISVPVVSFLAGESKSVSVLPFLTNYNSATDVITYIGATLPSWLTFNGTQFVSNGTQTTSFSGANLSVRRSGGTGIPSGVFSITVQPVQNVNDVFTQIITNPSQGGLHGGGFWWAAVRASNGDLNFGPDHPATVGFGTDPCMFVATKNPDADHMTWGGYYTGPWADAGGRYENTKMVTDPIADQAWYIGGGSSGSPGWYENVAKNFATWDWPTHQMIPKGPPTISSSNAHIFGMGSGHVSGYANDTLYWFGGFSSVAGATAIGRMVIRPFTNTITEIVVSGYAPATAGGSGDFTYNMFRGGFDSRTAQGWFFDKNGELNILNHNNSVGTWSIVPTTGNRPPNTTAALTEPNTFYGNWCLLETANCIVGYIGSNSVNTSPVNVINRWYVLDLGTLVWRQSSITNGPPALFAGVAELQYDRANERAVLFYHDSTLGGAVNVCAFKPGVLMP